jgi:hypothetical protein
MKLTVWKFFYLGVREEIDLTVSLLLNGNVTVYIEPFLGNKLKGYIFYLCKSGFLDKLNGYQVPKILYYAISYRLAIQRIVLNSLNSPPGFGHTIWICVRAGFPPIIDS